MNESRRDILSVFHKDKDIDVGQTKYFNFSRASPSPQLIPHFYASFASDALPKFHERLTNDSGINSKACLPVQQQDPFSSDEAREASTEPQKTHSMLRLKHVQGLFLTH